MTMAHGAWAWPAGAQVQLQELGFSVLSGRPPLARRAALTHEGLWGSAGETIFPRLISSSCVLDSS